MTPRADVVIGVHPNNHSLFVLRRTGLLEELLAPGGATVEWVEYDDGRCTIDLFADEEIDFGGTGSVPPIQAQSEGVDIVYVAVSDPRPAQGAVLVHADSPIETLADLRGRPVALMEGSYHTELLAFALDEAGLSYRDITVLDGLAHENREDFRSGAAEAWVAGDPFWAEAQAAGGVRVLTEVGRHISNRSTWWARRSFARRRPELLDSVVSALLRTDSWIAEHPREAAAMFAADVPDSPGVDDWETALRRRPWGQRVVSPAVVAEQQRAADLYARLGVIPTPVRIADAVPEPSPALREA
ncbi:ABC transporter substrate-binding protein [Amycolatopsis thermoflava]|uniref:ABC transporter substrate-binding protein n=1 Tax=Amycolatopsis thermoflava TaxID=84480 RepID=UPI00041068F5|nr:ABC transporter substrate-binding protein [Amycolatopsis thermoflava]